MAVSPFCEIFGALFVMFCSREQLNAVPSENLQVRFPDDKFQVEYQWKYINYTWPSNKEYERAIEKGIYIPEHNAIAGVKIYKDKLYFALPRLRIGAPVTLACIQATSKNKNNPLLVPFPSWEMNVQQSCFTLQNVQSMEIDSTGVMWVLDGNRFINFTQCPPKIILFDLNNRGKLLRIFEIPNEISLHRGGFLNDIVIDETDGGYAYITEASAEDPGIIVFSKRKNRAWKVRDRTMFAEKDVVDFIVDGVKNDKLVPVDGIALSPIPKRSDEERMVFYCALVGLNLFSISTKILKDEVKCKSANWRKEITYVGRKQGQSDGLVVDNRGNLYYGLLNSNGIARWNIYKPFSDAKIIEENKELLIWPDSFAFDDNGYLYVVTGGIHKYFDSNYPLNISDKYKFRVSKLYTGTNSYLHA